MFSVGPHNSKRAVQTGPFYGSVPGRCRTAVEVRQSVRRRMRRGRGEEGGGVAVTEVEVGAVVSVCC